MQINSLTLPAANRLVADYKNEEDNIINLLSESKRGSWLIRKVLGKI